MNEVRPTVCTQYGEGSISGTLQNYTKHSDFLPVGHRKARMVGPRQTEQIYIEQGLVM